MSDERPILYYFRGRGRAEIIRLMFVEAGVDYVDHRFKYQEGAGNVEFDELKMKGILPFGQVPHCSVDGMELGQTNSIVRYLAEKHGLISRDIKEAAYQDMIYQGIQDWTMQLYKVRFCKPEIRCLLLREFMDKVFPKWAGHFEAYLNANNEGQGYFVGENISFADLAAYDLFWTLDNLVPGCFDKYPTLKAFTERIGARPPIAEWVKNRPDSVY
eukprot:GFYU01000213.1.p1 GENE.GFYU01000213.1~~GFYU01000213.1.p1  ORF type:complete len:215 (+),score=59.86 GFYU01000213.1:117-761(+)